MLVDTDRLKMPLQTTLEYRDDTGSIVTITVPYGSLTGTEFVEMLVRPIMHGISYHPHTIAEALNDEEVGEDG